MAVVRKGSKDSESGKTKQWLEIWDKTTKLKSIDIDSLEEHSNIILDSQFSSFLWSPNGKHLLYVAEYKPPKAQSYYKKKKATESGDKETDSRGQEFVYREDWGESFDGVCHTVIAVLDITDFKIRTIEMNGLSLGQPFWIGSGDSVGFVAWNENPRRLGIVYCTNRLSSIYSYDLNSTDSVPKLICGSDNTTIRDPRPNWDRTAFVYLENESGGAHHKASRLMQYNFDTKANDIIIDVNSVREILTDGNRVKYGKICALYLDELPLNCFTSDGKYVVFHSFTELEKSLYLVNLKTKDLKAIEFPVNSATVVDIKDDIIIAVGSSVNVKPNIYIAKFNKENIDSIKWTKVETNPNQSIDDISFESYSIVSEDSNKLLNSILISPKSVESTIAPTVVLPHGGPHSLLFVTFMTYPILFAKLGLKTLLGIELYQLMSYFLFPIN
jgi:acylaminoacyl-peptidase